MTWTYSGDPSDSTRDAVRFMVGDTDVNDQLLSDEEIDYLVVEHGTINRISSEAARGIAAKFARLMTRSIGGLSADFSAKYRQYLELADNLMAREETYPVAPFSSGWRRDQKRAVEDELDRESTFSRKGIHDNDRVYPADDMNAYVYRRV